MLEAVFGNEQCEYEQRSLLGCVTMEYAISLEPAAQLEISIFSEKDRTGIRTDLRRVPKTNGVLFRTTPYAARNLWLSAVCKKPQSCH